MSLLEPLKLPVYTPERFNYEAATDPTPLGAYLGAKIQTGFDQSIAGLGIRQATGVGEGSGPLPDDGTSREQLAGMGYKVDQRRVTEDEWRKLKLDRPGLKFSGGGTVEYERARTRDYDERRYRESLIDRYKGGAGTYALGFGAQMLGGLPSPENFVPFVGPGVRAAMVARLGVIGGHIAAGAADAAIGNLAADALTFPDLNRRGEDLGVEDLALDLALGAVTGGLFGAGGGWLARRQQMRDVANAVRIDGLQRQADAVELALGAVTRDEAVDVGPVLADALPKVRERLDAAAPVETVSLPTTTPDQRIDIPGTAAREVETPEGPVIRAYHGSPHRFDQFSMEHIGKGEGAQAFGHGLYFAEREGVARSYLEKLGAGRGIGADDSAARILESVGGDQAKALEILDAREADVRKRLVERPETVPDGALERIAEQRKSLESGDPRGALYTVDIRAEPERMLDWDKPLSEQSEHVRKALEEHPDPMVAGTAAKWGGDIKSMISRLEQRVEGGAAAVSRLLREAGIEGIRYLDGGSRADGEGTRNYVIFDDSRIRIREINGKAVERAPDPPATLAEAEARLGKPRTAKQQAEDLGLGDPKATAQRLVAEDEAKAKAAEVAQKAPPDPQKEAALAQKALLSDIGEMQDVDALRRVGALTEADERALTEADDLMKRADGWADAYSILAGCSIRHGS